MIVDLMTDLYPLRRPTCGRNLSVIQDHARSSFRPLPRAFVEQGSDDVGYWSVSRYVAAVKPAGCRYHATSRLRTYSIRIMEVAQPTKDF
jgi:hypothetical protein